MAKDKFFVEHDEAEVIDFEWLLCEVTAAGSSCIAMFLCHSRATQVCDLLNAEEKLVGADEEESE